MYPRFARTERRFGAAARVRFGPVWLLIGAGSYGELDNVSRARRALLRVRLLEAEEAAMAESSSVVLYDPHTTDREVITAAGFLAGYSGRTREAYTLDLRQFVAWCRQHDIGLFDVRRAEIELYARHLEELGRARATIGRRLSTIAGFYRYATRKGSCPTRRQRTSAVLGWITSPTPSG